MTLFSIFYIFHNEKLSDDKKPLSLEFLIIMVDSSLCYITSIECDFMEFDESYLSTYLA